MKKIIVTADDYGISREVNEGIEEAVFYSIITGTSILANGILNNLGSLKKSNIAFGVHLNLTLGKPMYSEYPLEYLVNYNFPKFFRKDGRVQYSIKEEIIEREFESQIDKVKSIVNISYLDTHNHIHELSQVFSVVVKLAQKYNLAVRSINEEMTATLRKNGIKCTDRCFLDFYDEGATLDNLLVQLPKIEGNVLELVTHIGYSSSNINDNYNESREKEYNILKSKEAIIFMKKNYKKITYEELF
ncbi:ChbG/HpnK family deacetylase [Alkaliphilus serpentinus]|uniref:ChbG/HpnK family deacetylase n=1 Tax=Alkaliphilus serpentinus TaxID=1482731 RepID=A0A833HNN4_9FIRM|nr:ChbG/HpnK family deacetylase [Alkaliphilus serpentinus]KAB3529853.1 ChbG/HpnK family deacetylase [Alkaliphilus serpentinus]